MSTNSDTYIFFELAGSTYALPTGCVRHVEMIDQITPVPNAAPHVEGVVFSRGQVVPALDLRTRFGLPRQPRTARTRLIIIILQNRWLGLIVDQAREFRRIPPETIQPTDSTVSAATGFCLDATATVDGRLVLLPSIQRLLDPSEPNHSLLASERPLTNAST